MLNQVGYRLPKKLEEYDAEAPCPVFCKRNTGQLWNSIDIGATTPSGIQIRLLLSTASSTFTLSIGSKRKAVKMCSPIIFISDSGCCAIVVRKH